MDHLPESSVFFGIFLLASSHFSVFTDVLKHEINQRDWLQAIQSSVAIGQWLLIRALSTHFPLRKSKNENDGLEELWKEQNRPNPTERVNQLIEFFARLSKCVQNGPKEGHIRDVKKWEQKFDVHIDPEN